MEDMVGEAITAVAVAFSVLHLGAFLTVLGTTRQHRAGARAGLLAASLVPFFGPVLAVLTAVASRRSG